MRVRTNTGAGLRSGSSWEGAFFCGINSLQLPPSRMWLLFISGGWCDVLFPWERFSSRWEKRQSCSPGETLLMTPICVSFVSRKSAATLFSFLFFLRQHLAKMRESAPPGFPNCEASFSVHVSSPRLPAEEDAAFSCMKWKEVSRGVTKYTGDCFWLLRSRYEEPLAAARPSPPPSVWCLSLAAIFPSS